MAKVKVFLSFEFDRDENYAVSRFGLRNLVSLLKMIYNYASSILRIKCIIMFLSLQEIQRLHSEKQNLIIHCSFQKVQMFSYVIL